MITWLLCLGAAFLSGSIPFGLIVGRLKGIDIREHGSGNIGATNAVRVLGIKLGLLCLLLDVLKGFAPTFGAGLVTHAIADARRGTPLDQMRAALWLAVMVAAVLGHMFSPWVGFRGGKGVATGLGAMLGVFPILTFPALAALGVWIFIAATTRYSSLASMLAALSLPLWLWFMEGGTAGLELFYAVTVGMALLVIARHRGNIRRILAGTESRIGTRAKPSSDNRTGQA